MRFGRKKTAEPRESAFERRTLLGVPSVFTGRDTTLGEQRRMAREVLDEAAQTPTERGLAISLLAVLSMYEADWEPVEGDWQDWVENPPCWGPNPENGLMMVDMSVDDFRADVRRVIAQARKEGE